MKTRTFAKTLGVAFLLAVSACAPRATGAVDNGDAVLLRFRPEPGQTYRMVSVMDQSTSQTSMGQQLHTHQVVTSTMRYDVDRPASAGEALRLRTTWEGVRVEGDGPFGHVSYDSSDPASDVPWTIAPLAAFVGHTFTASVAADGTRSILGMDSLVDDLLAQMKLPPGMSRANFLGMVKQQLGKGPTSGMTQGLPSILPDHPVSVGESWTQLVDMAGPLPFHQTMTMTLRERRNGVAIIDMRSETVGDSTAAPVTSPPSMLVKGTGTGTLEVDEATGWTLRSTIETEISTTIILEHSPAGRQEIPMTARIVMTTRPAGDD